jgi:hypothetical protein
MSEAPSFTPGVKRKREIFISGNATDQMVNVAINIDQILTDMERYAGGRLNIELEVSIRRRLAALIESNKAEITAIRGIVSKAAGRSGGRTRPAGRQGQGIQKTSSGNGKVKPQSTSVVQSPLAKNSAPGESTTKNTGPKKASAKKKSSTPKAPKAAALADAPAAVNG